MSALLASVRDETLAILGDDGNGATSTVTLRAGSKNDRMGMGLLIHVSCWWPG
jgi:hypothetical protein